MHSTQLNSTQLNSDCKRFIKLLVLFTLFGINYAYADTTEYKLDWKIGSDEIIAKFNGTATGNFITNISNASVFFDGVAFSGNGSLFVDSISLFGGFWLSSGAQISFDGTYNNFVFANSNLAIGDTATNYFYSIEVPGQSYNYLVIGSEKHYGFSNSGYSVSAVPEAGEWAMMLLGLPLLGWVVRRKQSAMQIATA
ncbi:hypothetical protein [Methylomonas sp. AM2-LC]|uniref:hypothetical protein n=1 Tax=Methylomonas sp. AM2-LC TaxID=3153301 RepID=UPI00326426AF